jgi:hypothetical protein
MPHRRVAATGRIVISGPSTRTKRFVLWHIGRFHVPLTPALTCGFVGCKGYIGFAGSVSLHEPRSCADRAERSAGRELTAMIMLVAFVAAGAGTWYLLGR